ncbi:MAG: multicopper oxidase domain-containing protein [Bacteroidia bacterium]
MEKIYSPIKCSVRHVYAFSLISILALTSGFSQSFTIRMPIPDLYDRRADTLSVDIETHDFGTPALSNVETFAYNHKYGTTNDYLGPTLTWIVGDTQSTHIVNNLPMGSGMTTTVHWHGANIPAWTDGGPHQFFGPGESFTPRFKVLDAPTTLWYHPHAEDRTYTQVQMGLAGIIIVRENGDPVEAIAPHTYGWDDIPLIIQDIYFDSATASIDTGKVGQATGNNATPRQLLVNGTIQPFLDVPPQPVRFRILDGSTRMSYMLGFVTDTTNPQVSRIPYYLFSSDGGYLPDSVRKITSLEASPGVRNGVIVDFSNYANSEIYLMNFSDELRQGVIGSDSTGNHGSNPIKNKILQIRVGASQLPPIGAIPSSLPGIPAADTLSPDTTRTVRLTKSPSGGTTTAVFGIDDNQYDYNKINTVVKLNTIEDWTIRNETNAAHPFHIHLIQFYVMKVEKLDGTPLPFPDKYLGPKDNILVHPGEQVTFRARFNSYGRPKPFDTPGQIDSAAYMYHCHILTHEDGYYHPSDKTLGQFGMMQQFAVWDGTYTATALDEPMADEMVLFPNPAGDLLYLNAEASRVSTVRISDIQGRILKEQLLPPFAGTTSINVSELGKGMILVEWISNGNRQVKKILLE